MEQEQKALIYPMPRRRFYGMFVFTKRRVVSGSVCAMFIVATLPLLPLCLGFVVLWGYLVIKPTVDGFGCDTLARKIRSKRLRKDGGYFYAPRVQTSGEWEGGVGVVTYTLPPSLGATDMGVARNDRLGHEVAYVIIRDWNGCAFGDEPERLRCDLDLNGVLLDVMESLVDNIRLITMRRTADDTFVAEHIDAYVTEDMRAEMMEIAHRLYSTSSEVTYLFALHCDIPKDPQTLLSLGQWRKIPAIVAISDTVTKLDEIGIRCEVHTSAELHTMLRTMFDPADSLTYQLAALDRRDTGDDEEGFVSVFGSRAEQRPAIPRVARGGKNWLQVGDSYHSVAVTAKFRRSGMPAGFLDGLYQGLSDWCLVTTEINWEDKEPRRRKAKASRAWRLTAREVLEEKGHIATKAEEDAVTDAVRLLDDLEDTEGGVYYYSIYVTFSGMSPEELDDQFETIRLTAAKYGLVIERIEGESVQLEAFHVATGLK